MSTPRRSIWITLSLVLTPLACLGVDLPSPTSIEPGGLTSSDWPWWRGPHRNGVADDEFLPPLEWSATENVAWKSPVPGRGHGSPTVVDEQIFLAAADHERQIQSVICFDRRRGERQWERVVHRNGLTDKGNEKASLASSSIACDGVRIFINFLNNGAIYTSALSRSGEVLWQTKISDYVVHQGYGSSPAIYQLLVIVSADNKGGGAIAALDRTSGEIVWSHRRPKKPNYASPIILKAAGRDQLLFTGCNLVSSFAPRTGERLWEIPGATTECVTSILTDGELVFTSGGYPENHVSAVRADGSGQVVWRNSTRVYVPSMLVREGYLYAVADAGIAFCWRARTGEIAWKGRLGGTFTASPVLVGNYIYATNEDGTTYIYRAEPTGLDLVSTNQLGDQVYATMAISRGQIFTRVAEMSGGQRQEMLYCLAEAKDAG